MRFLLFISGFFSIFVFRDSMDDSRSQAPSKRKRGTSSAFGDMCTEPRPMFRMRKREGAPLVAGPTPVSSGDEGLPTSASTIASAQQFVLAKSSALKGKKRTSAAE